MSEFKPNANGKENYCISKPNKEQLTRYIQALSKTVTHTTHTHFFHRLTPSFSFILPSLALFFFQRLASLRLCACVQLLRNPKGGKWRAWEGGRSPLLSGSNLFSRISFASVPSSIRSNLVITPMVLRPVSHRRGNDFTQTLSTKLFANLKQKIWLCLLTVCGHA